MRIAVKPKIEIQKQRERIQGEISTDQSLFQKHLLSSVSSSVLLTDTESNLFTWHGLCSIVELGRLDAVNCFYQLKESTACQVG